MSERLWRICKLQRQRKQHTTGEMFKLPYKIEMDKVESYSIKMSFDKQENWTKALKYILNNLKWVLHWFFGNTSFQPLAVTVASHSDIPNSGSSRRKRPPNHPPPGPKT